jgi:ABC-2 type transport system ATP-binding protein
VEIVKIAPSDPVLKVVSVSKQFGDKRVVDDVSFCAAKGEIVGVLGPNGAGKSTLIGILSGLLEPDSGLIEIFGWSYRQKRSQILARMNVMSPYASFPGQLTVRQNLAVYADLYGVPQPARRIDELLDTFDIGHTADTRFFRLSSGQSVRVSLCKALLNKPDLLLLDEPTVYLDAEAAARTRSVILGERAQRGMTILLTSHNITEIEQLCDRIVLLDKGRVAAAGAPLDVTRAILGPDASAVALGGAIARLARGRP